MAAGNADESGDGFLDLLHRRVVTIEGFIVVLLPGGHFAQNAIDFLHALIELLLAFGRLLHTPIELLLALGRLLRTPIELLLAFGRLLHTPI